MTWAWLMVAASISTSSTASTSAAPRSAPSLASPSSLAPIAPAPTSTAALEWSLKGQLFVRFRVIRGASDTLETRTSLARARLSVTARYEDWIRLTLEPEFAALACSAQGTVCDDAEVADAFVDLTPGEVFELRMGQAKTPYGLFETTSEWRLPTQRRGLVSEVVADRAGIGGRHLGIRARGRLKDAPLRPGLELAAYSDIGSDREPDLAARLFARPFKKAELALSGYARAKLATSGGHGYAASASFAYDDGATFAALELGLVRARHLTLTGVDLGEDSTWLYGRALLAHAWPVGQDLSLEPYLALDVLDPAAATSEDLGAALRGGLNLGYRDLLRLGLEVERRGVARGFVSPELTVFSLFLGASME